MVLGYDGRFVGAERGAIYRNIASHKGAMVRGDFAPAEKIRENAPARPANPLWIMDGTYAGEDHAAKKEKVRKALNERGVSALLLSKLDDIMWFTNLRGSDISCNPVGLSYLIMEDDTVELFLQPESVTAEVRGYLNENGIVLKEYASFFEELKGRSFAGGVLADPKAVSDRMIEILSANAVRPQFGNSPTSFLKATKTEAELEQIRECYRNDSAVLCRFLFEVERDLGRVFMTEISLAEKLNDMRRKIPGFLDLSFETISACGPNAAIVHYEPKEETNAEIRPEGFYLVDSGGQYRNGTTDVTRTVPLGDLTQAMRRDFTLVAIANLRLLTAKFKYGCTGANLDMYARSPLWEDGLDFGHGTGHGIGFVLNVHEGPQNIAWRIRRGLTGAETVFEPGMIVSDEPGIYRAGEYGIRTESIVECIEDETNAFGRFLRFRPLTYVPISLKALDESLMDASDIRRLNDYHKAVYETISPLLESSEERKWLKEATAPIGQTAVSRKLTDS